MSKPYKTKQQEIDWLRRELACAMQDAKDDREQIAKLRETAKINDAIVNRLGSICWDFWKRDGDLCDVVKALVENHKSYLALIATRKSVAKNRVKDADALIAALRFVGECTCSSSGATYVGGENLSLSIDKILRKACDKIRSLVTADYGLLQGSQDSQIIDAVAKLKEEKACAKT